MNKEPSDIEKGFVYGLAVGCFVTAVLYFLLDQSLSCLL
jgi:hypothetical protein